MTHHSVQLVMLRAPDPRAAASYYTEALNFRFEREEDGEVLLDGYGLQLVISVGPGAQRASLPDPEDTELSFVVPMEVMEAVWERDRASNSGVSGPVLAETGMFVYVSLDPGGNALTLLSQLPGRDFGGRRPTTQRLRRVD